MDQKLSTTNSELAGELLKGDFEVVEIDETLSGTVLPSSHNHLVTKRSQPLFEARRRFQPSIVQFRWYLVAQPVGLQIFYARFYLPSSQRELLVGLQGRVPAFPWPYIHKASSLHH